MIPGGFAYGHLCGPPLDGVLYSGLWGGGDIIGFIWRKEDACRLTRIPIVLVAIC
jgi:hypothetical protein